MDALIPALPWYVARSGGIVAWALVTVSVVVGLVQSTRVARGRANPAWLRGFHANAGGMALAFTGIHVVGLLLDTTVHFSVADVLLPFAAAWRPLAVAWGIVAMYLLLAVGITAWARRRLPRGAWLKVHRISALTYGLATAHLLTAGTDVANPVLAGTALVSMFVVAALVFTRLWASHTRSGTARASGNARPRAHTQATPRPEFSRRP
jgi:DMSO/TMAO reductase YedYZ heme-binding membrane subunit